MCVFALPPRSAIASRCITWVPARRDASSPTIPAGENEASPSAGASRRGISPPAHRPLRLPGKSSFGGAACQLLDHLACLRRSNVLENLDGAEMTEHFNIVDPARDFLLKLLNAALHLQRNALVLGFSKDVFRQGAQFFQLLHSRMARLKLVASQVLDEAAEPSLV